MSFAIFLRAVNVGGHQSLSVSDVARKLGLTNIGAAGTFIAHRGTAEKMRASIKKEMRFETQIMTVEATELRALVASDPFAGVEGKPYVIILGKPPERLPGFPFEDKGVRLLGVRGVFALAVVVPGAPPGTAPNVERLLGVPGTARGWPTILRVAAALDERPRS